MAELETKQNNASVSAFLATVEDEQKRKDCKVIAKIMKEISGAPAKMWGTSIVGFGTYHYRGASGKEVAWMRIGFSPRKQNLTLYLLAGFEGQASLLKKLGKHKTGKACLYIKRLADVDMAVLRELIASSVAQKF